MIHDAIKSLRHDLGPGLRVWTVDLDGYAAAAVLTGLSEEDYSRADRMAPVDGRRLLASRHALRAILAAASGREPSSLEIVLDPGGKPRLARSGPGFNASRSGGTALIGIRRAGAVGVDLEALRAVPEEEGIVADAFTRQEREAWQRANQRERPGIFLRCWTRKEACAKALGLGVRIPFDRIAVGAERGHTVASIAIGSVDLALRVASLEPGDDLVGAVAVADPLVVRRTQNVLSRGKARAWFV